MNKKQYEAERQNVETLEDFEALVTRMRESHQASGEDLGIPTSEPSAPTYSEEELDLEARREAKRMQAMLEYNQKTYLYSLDGKTVLRDERGKPILKSKGEGSIYNDVVQVGNQTCRLSQAANGSWWVHGYVPPAPKADEVVIEANQ